MSDDYFSRRAKFLFIGIIAFFIFLSLRLTYLQTFNATSLSAKAESQGRLIQELSPFRGRILDRNGEELAVDVQLYSLAANPRRTKNPEYLAQELSRLLNLPIEFVRGRLLRDKEFVWIKRQLSSEETEEIQSMDFDELILRPEWKRVYPNGELASQVIGFANIDNVGLEGIEARYESYLKGVAGYKSSIKDVRRREVVSRQRVLVMPTDGFDIQLTLDSVLQHAADKLLAQACKKYRALGGSLIVMDAVNGDVLALSNSPRTNLNEPRGSDASKRRNRAITDMFEPGSIFKLITMSAALAEKVVKQNDIVFCENGQWRTGGRLLHDAHPYGDLSVIDVLVKSSNIGTAKIAKKIGKEKLYAMIKRFGFGNRTGIDLPGEINGLITHPKNWSATSISSVPMGQEVGVTAIQMVSAVSAIVNGGLLPKPRIVAHIGPRDGEAVKTFSPEIQRRVISEEVSEIVKNMMVQVVQRGTGRRARVEGELVGGKTGTAQKIDENGAYSHSSFISSFAGFIERDGRIFAILATIDDPKPQYYGGTVAAPIVGAMAKVIANYLF
ncbi:MAG: cell division protein FtsI (penicillin-binding protein 3) [Candidatus Omnitrophota bacterium]|jgi:cell division protein FtsI (penicillin-binding protein 3)